MSIIRPRLNDFYNIPITQEEVDFAIPFIAYTNAWVYSKTLCKLESDTSESCQSNKIHTIMKEIPFISETQMNYWNHVINEFVIIKKNKQYINDITFIVKDASSSKFKAYKTRCEAEMKGDNAVLKNVLEATIDSIENIIYDSSSSNNNLGHIIFQKNTYDMMFKNHINRTKEEILSYRQMKNAIIDLGKVRVNNTDRVNKRLPLRNINLELANPSIWNRICGKKCSPPPMKTVTRIGSAISSINTLILGYHLHNKLQFVCGKSSLPSIIQKDDNNNNNNSNNNDKFALIDRTPGSSRNFHEPKKLMDFLKSKKSIMPTSTSTSTNDGSSVTYVQYESKDICPLYLETSKSNIFLTPHGFQETLILLLMGIVPFDFSFYEIFPSRKVIFKTYEILCQHFDNCKYHLVYSKCIVPKGKKNKLLEMNPKECNVEVTSNDIST